jgi:uncharacterized protein
VKKYLKDKLPSPDTFYNNRFLWIFAPWLSHPRLWCLHRRGVALGIAIGLVTGLVPGPFQILLAVVFAITFRANIPAAAFATFYTNPFTFVPLYLLAYKIGALITGEKAAMTSLPNFSWNLKAMSDLGPQIFKWFVSMGDTLLIGLAVQATLTALLGYIATMIIWRCAVSKIWRARRLQRKQSTV